MRRTPTVSNDVGPDLLPTPVPCGHLTLLVLSASHQLTALHAELMPFRCPSSPLSSRATLVLGIIRRRFDAVAGPASSSCLPFSRVQPSSEPLASQTEKITFIAMNRGLLRKPSPPTQGQGIDGARVGTGGRPITAHARAASPFPQRPPYRNILAGTPGSSSRSGGS
jgi:hypothetical protein